jgi:hypothetical protein
MNAVISAGQVVPAKGDGPDQGPQRDLQHAEIQSVQSDTEHADQQTGKSSRQRPGHKSHPPRQGGLG